MTDEQKQRLKELLISGALSGAVLGGGGAALTGAKTLGAIGKSALSGAGLGAALGGGSNLAADAVLGEPNPNDPTAYSKRGAVGGALAGGLGGAALGAIAAGGSKGGFSRMARAALMNKLGRGAVAKGVGKLGSRSAGAGIVGGLGALVGGYQGGDEGMQMDFYKGLKANERQRKAAKMREELGYAE